MLTRIFGTRRKQARAHIDLSRTDNSRNGNFIASTIQDNFDRLPLFPKRNNTIAGAFTAYHVRTAHNTTLVAADDSATLLHRPTPRSGRETILFHSTAMPLIGLLVASRDLDLRDGTPAGSITPFLIVGAPATGSFALRSPVRNIHLCAIGGDAGETDFNRAWIGPWEQFHAEKLFAPIIDQETEQALEQIGILIEGQLDPAMAAAWAISASERTRRIGLPVLMQLLARNDLSQQPAERIEAQTQLLMSQATSGPAIMSPATGGMTLLERIEPWSSGFLWDRLRSGWHMDNEGRCSAAAARAAIEFNLPYRPLHARLRLRMNATHQLRLVDVSVNGWSIGRSAVGLDKVPGSCLDYWIPKEALSSQELLVTFDTTPEPSPQAPAFTLSVLTLEIGPPAPEISQPQDYGTLMGSFESLGDDCEFGFVQRSFGIDPLGIFRFSGTSSLSNLLHLLETDLEGMGTPGSLTSVFRHAHIYRFPEPPLVIEEFLMNDHKLGYLFHTWRGPQEATEEVAREENEQKLRYLRRKFLEDLEDGEKIWLLKDAKGQDINEAFAFHDVLNRRGRNKLFWVTRTVEGRPSGCVEWIGRDLLRGDSDQPHADAQVFTPDVWLALCQNAWRAFAERAD